MEPRDNSVYLPNLSEGVAPTPLLGSDERDIVAELEALIAAEDAILFVYPCVIAPTRYGGVYEGAPWAAYGVASVPEGAIDSDIECAEWWAAPTCLVGRGRTPDTAFADLERAFKSCRHPGQHDYVGMSDVAIICDWCRQVLGRKPKPVA